MKKFILILLSLMLVAIFAVTGCNGVYNPPTVPPDDGNDGGTSIIPPDEPPVDDGKIIFTVTLICEGQNFHPDTEIHAQWSGEDGLFDEKFNALGVASRELDGDYVVTLSHVPEEYTYDPNGLTADNDHRNLIIELLPIIPTIGTGSDRYAGAIELDRTGTYKTTLNSRDHIVYYRYAPTAPGRYAIQSIVDIDANEINPFMNYHLGTFAWTPETPTRIYNDGGASSTFTKNFKFSLTIRADEIAPPTPGVGDISGVTWTFGLHADCTGSYPIDIYFTIKYEGSYTGGGIIYDEVVPNGPFAKIQPTGTWRYSYEDSNRTLLTEGIKEHWTGAEGKMYDSIKLNWTDTNANGKYDPAEWTDTNGNGVFEAGDEWMDINGDGICAVQDEWWDTNKNGYYDPNVDYYKDTNNNGIIEVNGDCWRDTNGNGVFDNGDEWFDSNNNGSCDMGDGGDGFYHLYDKDLYADTDGYGPILFTKFSGASEIMDTGFDNEQVSKRLQYKGGNYDYANFVVTYIEYCNNDGAVPVNAELQFFLQAYAAIQSFFDDGFGIAEQSIENDGLGLSSNEDNMWLIFCGYYS